MSQFQTTIKDLTAMLKHNHKEQKQVLSSFREEVFKMTITMVQKADVYLELSVSATQDYIKLRTSYELLEKRGE